MALNMISAKGRGEDTSKNRHTEAQMIGALKQIPRDAPLRREGDLSRCDQAIGT